MHSQRQGISGSYMTLYVSYSWVRHIMKCVNVWVQEIKLEREGCGRLKSWAGG